MLSLTLPSHSAHPQVQNQALILIISILSQFLFEYGRVLYNRDISRVTRDLRSVKGLSFISTTRSRMQTSWIMLMCFGWRTVIHFARSVLLM